MKTSSRKFLVMGASAGAGAAIYSLLSKLEPLSAAQLTGLTQPSTAGKRWVFIIDLDRCIGCRICLAACPYERRFFNWFDPPITEEQKQQAYSVDSNTPNRRGVVEKCIWCRHRLLMGKLPACVEGCTRAGMKALWFSGAPKIIGASALNTAFLSLMMILSILFCSAGVYYAAKFYRRYGSPSPLKPISLLQRRDSMARAGCLPNGADRDLQDPHSLRRERVASSSR